MLGQETRKCQCGVGPPRQRLVSLRSLLILSFFLIFLFFVSLVIFFPRSRVTVQAMIFVCLLASLAGLLCEHLRFSLGKRYTLEHSLRKICYER